MCKTASKWGVAVKHRELSWVLCDDLEGLDGDETGREVQEQGDICILMSDSSCMAETNATL